MWWRVVTLRWRMVSLRLWRPRTIFMRWEGCFFERIFRLAWLSTIVTSMSATAHAFCSCFGVPRVVYWGNVKNSAKGVFHSFNPTFSSPCFLLFSPSIDCKTCSNSFTKLIAPPMIDAWSPCFSKLTQLPLTNSLTN